MFFFFGFWGFEGLGEGGSFFFFWCESSVFVCLRVFLLDDVNKVCALGLCL